jgi:hypothetical protein
MAEERYNQVIEVNIPAINTEVQVQADVKRGHTKVTHITYVADKGQDEVLVQLTAPIRINGRDIIGESLPLALIAPEAGSDIFNLMREIEPPAEGDGTRFETKLIYTSITPGATSGRFILTLEK